MWGDLTTGLCVLGFTAAITLLLTELPAVFDLPSVVADQRLRGQQRLGRSLNHGTNPEPSDPLAD
jgi:hypothetical protein